MEIPTTISSNQDAALAVVARDVPMFLGCELGLLSHSLSYIHSGPILGRLTSHD
jgi:hypothetical protein